MGGHAEGVLCTYQVVKVECTGNRVLGIRVLYLAVQVECRD